jgi:hypothetical protein
VSAAKLMKANTIALQIAKNPFNRFLIYRFPIPDFKFFSHALASSNYSMPHNKPISVTDDQLLAPLSPLNALQDDFSNLL